MNMIDKLILLFLSNIVILIMFVMVFKHHKCLYKLTTRNIFLDIILWIFLISGGAILICVVAIVYLIKGHIELNKYQKNNNYKPFKIKETVALIFAHLKCK